MTKRRLINKKAYDELLLLQDLLSTVTDNSFKVSIQVIDEVEMFVVEHYRDVWIHTMFGENYTEISKTIIVYLSSL